MPEREGYVFDGWWTSLSTGGVKVDAKTKVGQGDTCVVCEVDSKLISLIYMGGKTFLLGLNYG